MKYNVHRVSMTEIETTATLTAGVVSNVKAPCLEVELLAADHMGSSMTLRFVGKDEIAAAWKKYSKAIQVSFDDSAIAVTSYQAESEQAA